MLCEEQGGSLLKELIKDRDTHPEIRRLLKEILEVLKRHLT